MQAIIYPTDQGGIAVIIPAPDCGIPLREIARKDVPAGVPFRIIPTSAIPQDRTYRDAWTADFSNPDGAGLGPHRWWIGQFTAEIAQLEAQEPPADADAAEKFEAARAASIAALKAKIETMKAEVLKIEGVQL
jgi:hypothetical protein